MEFHDNGVAYGLLEISTSYSQYTENQVDISITVYCQRHDYGGASDGMFSVDAPGFSPSSGGYNMVLSNKSWYECGTYTTTANTDSAGNASVDFYAKVGAKSPSKGWFYSDIYLNTIECGTPPRLYYNVDFHANGGSGAPGRQRKKKGQGLRLSTTKPTRSGYNFMGWATSSGSSYVSYNPGDYYYSDQDITLYAVWSIKTYTISYDANTGSGAPGSQNKTHGTAINLSNTRPTKTGYTFLHWNTRSDNAGTSYNPGARYTTEASATLYAIWKVNQYTVTYNPNGAPGSTWSEKATYNQNFTVQPNWYSRPGYTFAGWNERSDGTGADWTPQITQPWKWTYTRDVTLYAIWTPNKYTIRFDPNGGSGALSEQHMTYGTGAYLDPNPYTWEGRTFLGWDTSPSGSSVVYGNESWVNNLVTSPDGEITLYAVWSINQVLVTFDAATNGGTCSEGSRHVNYGSGIASLPVATRPYYRFLGWFTAPSGGTKITQEYKFTVSTTIYAQFAIDASASINVKGSWKRGIPYIRVDGVWHKGYAWINVKKQWKQGIG